MGRRRRRRDDDAAAAAAPSSSRDDPEYDSVTEGAVTFAGGEELRTGIYEVDALKPTGAGDSFMAGLIASLTEGRPLREAVLRGSACASIVVAKPGCAPAMPDEAELKAFLDTHSGPTQG